MQSYGRTAFKFLVISLALIVLFGPLCAWLASDSPSRLWTDKNFLPAPSGEDAGFSQSVYVAIGDSITAGADSTRGYAPMDYPYPKLVQAALGLKNSINYGANGTYLTDYKGDGSAIVSRYTQMENCADIVSVLGGINDFCEGDGKTTSVPLGSSGDGGVKTIYGALNTLAAGLKAKYPRAFIFFMTPLPVTPPHYPPVVTYGLDELAGAVKEVAAVHNLPVLDLYADCPYQNEMFLPYSDGIHPSQEFVASVLAPLITDFIRRNYAPPAQK